MQMTELRDIKKISIVGGGTAGWLSALYVKTILSHVEVTVIESEEIGILGAGEGTVPHLINLLDFLNIPVSRLVNDADATIKNGIKFTNWNNGGKEDFYYHSFAIYDGLWIDGLNMNEYAHTVLPALVSNVMWGDHVNDIDFVCKISEKNKVPFSINYSQNNSNLNPILNYKHLGTYALHFNANKLAKVLRTIAEERGVLRFEGVVSDYSVDKYKDIKTLIFESGQEISCDFIFDCSGFSRFFMKKLGATWKSHNEYLPVDSAIPFFLPQDQDAIPPYTESIAMKYGWMWKIPLQSRYGCGYVYDSSLITPEEARKEIVDYLGFEPEFPRKDGFKFSAGYYEQPWINNCISVGLASGFIEPLEATSIWVSVMTLRNALANVEVLSSRDKRVADDFNQKFCDINDQVVDFIYFHYMSGRTDTEFWEKFTYNNAPKNVKKMLDTWEFRLPQYIDYAGKIWSMHSWLEVALGVKKVNVELFDYTGHNSPPQQWAANGYDTLKTFQNKMTEATVDHKEFLESLKNDI
jgi:tryptophan halogenase